MDTGLIAYSGISVKMLVDHTRGAHLLTLFMVDYAVNGAAQVHDHPFEEAYFFLDGDTAFELGGEQYRFGPRRRRMGGGRRDPRLLQHRRRAGAVAGDPGSGAAGPALLSVARRLGSIPTGQPLKG